MMMLWLPPCTWVITTCQGTSNDALLIAVCSPRTGS
uniref:Uncharacterized protein n=1 Tax=Arundo donax TaxID=35708 RepID=A0A0A9DTC1_ARUDO